MNSHLYQSFLMFIIFELANDSPICQPSNTFVERTEILATRIRVYLSKTPTPLNKSLILLCNFAWQATPLLHHTDFRFILFPNRSRLVVHSFHSSSRTHLVVVLLIIICVVICDLLPACQSHGCIYSICFCATRLTDMQKCHANCVVCSLSVYFSGFALRPVGTHLHIADRKATKRVIVIGSNANVRKYIIFLTEMHILR